MAKYRIIGNMTGNSMDAIDLVLTEFNADKMTDICTYSQPYDKNMQNDMEKLRGLTFNKTATEINKLPEFNHIHDIYIRQIADCINAMCAQHNIAKSTINAIGFHGKTLDHNPPSKAKSNGTKPYTLQIGSGQMLADLTDIPVVYDFRSDLLMAGFEGAPLIPPHNAHIAATEGDGIYYNGGNTSNFAIITNGRVQIGTDAGPFNEYTDNYMRLHTDYSFDKDGLFGKQGSLNRNLLQKIFALGRSFYEAPLPKSGDPAYYHKAEIFRYAQQQDIPFADVIHTFEYAAAYIAVQSLTLLPADLQIPQQILLFGGGWKNPLVRTSFVDLLAGRGFILPEHQNSFAQFLSKYPADFSVRQSACGDFMEARLLADLARYKLADKAWEIPETLSANKNIVCGIIATPNPQRTVYADKVNRAAKGWQK